MERHRERKAPPHRVGAPCTVGRAGSDATVSAEPSDRHLDQRTAERYTLTAVPECRPVCLLWSGAHGTATGHTHLLREDRGGGPRRPAPDARGRGTEWGDETSTECGLCSVVAPRRIGRTRLARRPVPRTAAGAAHVSCEMCTVRYRELV